MISQAQAVAPAALATRTLEPEIIDRAAAGSFRVLAMKSPFTMSRIDTQVPEGSTLADILQSLELEDWKDAIISVDGLPVERRWWPSVRPKAGHVVAIRCVPRGGGGDSSSKGWIQVAAGVILIIAGVVLSVASGGTLSWIGVPMVMMGVGLALSGAVTLLFPPPSLPKLKAGSGSDSPVYSITGSRNVANPWGAVPGVWGADAPPVSFVKAP